MKTKIILGQINLSFHKVAAGIFHHLLDYWGYDVEMITATHEKIFPQQEHGEIDLLISAWLPGSHGKYLSPYEENTIKFNPIYEPSCIWGVPSYIPKNLVSEIKDLNKEDVLSKMDKTINGIGMGAGISRFSVEMIKAYGLTKNGYKFTSNSFEKFCKITENNLTKKRWIIIPLWYPQYLHKMFDIRPLIEPKGLLRGKDLATPILLKKSQNLFSPKHIEVLSKIYLGNEVISQMDYSFNKEGKTAYEIAEQFLAQENGNIEEFIINLEKQQQK